MKPIRKMVWCLAVMALLACTGTSRAEFKVRKVIDLGKADAGSLLGGLRWSPDGKQLAYFSEGYLRLADTTGKSKEVMKLSGEVERFEWLDSSMLIITYCDRVRGSTEVRRLVAVDTEIGFETELESAERSGHAPPTGTVINGPRKTLEGGVYYASDIRPNTPWKAVLGGKSMPRIATATSDSHILQWGYQSDGLYKVTLDGSDSVKLMNGERPSGFFAPRMSQDGRFLVHGNLIVEISGDTGRIVVDMRKDLVIPEKTHGCGISSSSTFIPCFPEVVCNITCDDGVSYVVPFVGIYDRPTDKMQILDDLIGRKNCAYATPSPNGTAISLLSQGHAILVLRE
jgi:hypothetical protein